VIILAIAGWRRRGVLRTWRDGIRAAGVVVDIKHSAAAPRSRLVRFTFAEGPDRRVLTALYPAGAALPRPGDPLVLLVPLDRPDDAIVADLYARPGDVQTLIDRPI
jgi:hypothetical protein